MMGESTVTVDAGACCHKTKIHVIMNDDFTVTVELESDCPMVMEKPFPQGLSAIEEIGAPFTESSVYKWASETLRHTACPVPCAIIKTIENSGGLAVKKDPVIHFE